MAQDSSGVYQLKNGNWAYRFCVSVDGQAISKRSSRDAQGGILLTRKEAVKARMAAIMAAQNKTPNETAAPVIESRTFAEVFEEYREKGRSDRAYNTKLKQDSIWKNHLQEAFGDKFIDEITTADVQDYLAKLYYEDGYAFRYVESFLKMFYLVFGQAYSRNYLPVDLYHRLCINKDTKIHMPKVKTDDDLDIVAFSNEECAMLDDYFHGTNAETAYMLGRYCGLRINECYGLKWSQVDLENGVIYIEQQMQYQQGLIKLVRLKTKNARRKVYLSKKMIEYFTALSADREQAKVNQQKQREQNQTFIVDTDGSKISCLDLVNCLPNGKIQTVNSMKFHSRTLQGKYGIMFKYHYLRHTYGTQLAVLNTPTHILCNQMGHGNIHVTELYYIAVSKNGIDALRHNLERL